MKPERHIIVGDVHGCREELHELLLQVGYRPGWDQLVLVGDLVDRGPHSVGVLRWVRELEAAGGAVSLAGNHEEKIVRYHHLLAHALGAEAQLTESQLQVYRQLAPADLDWISRRPYFFKGPGFLVVHAGICPQIHHTLEDLDRNREARRRLVRIRHVDAFGNMLKLIQAGVPGARPWQEVYDGRFGVVVHGHWRCGEVMRGPFSYGLDTSCCYGGKLTAMVFTDLQRPAFVSVPARQTYRHPPPIG